MKPGILQSPWLEKQAQSWLWWESPQKKGHLVVCVDKINGHNKRLFMKIGKYCHECPRRGVGRIDGERSVNGRWDQVWSYVLMHCLELSALSER